MEPHWLAARPPSRGSNSNTPTRRVSFERSFCCRFAFFWKHRRASTVGVQQVGNCRPALLGVRTWNPDTATICRRPTSYQRARRNKVRLSPSQLTITPLASFSGRPAEPARAVCLFIAAVPG